MPFPRKSAAKLIREYLDNGTSMYRLCKDGDIPNYTMYRLLAGHPPSWRVAIKLEKGSHGALQRHKLLPELFEGYVRQ